MSFKDDILKVEHFIGGIVESILPVVAVVNPVLAGEAKLAVDILNALALNTEQVTTQTAISSAISAIHANPDLASKILSKINLNSVADVLNDAKVASEAINNVQSVVKDNLTSQSTSQSLMQDGAITTQKLYSHAVYANELTGEIVNKLVTDGSVSGFIKPGSVLSPREFNNKIDYGYSHLMPDVIVNNTPANIDVKAQEVQTTAPSPQQPAVNFRDVDPTANQG